MNKPYLIITTSIRIYVRLGQLGINSTIYLDDLAKINENISDRVYKIIFISAVDCANEIKSELEAGGYDVLAYQASYPSKYRKTGDLVGFMEDHGDAEKLEDVLKEFCLCQV